MMYRRTIVQTAALSSAFLFRLGSGSHCQEGSCSASSLTPESQLTSGGAHNKPLSSDVSETSANFTFSGSIGLDMHSRNKIPKELQQHPGYVNVHSNPVKLPDHRYDEIEFLDPREPGNGSIPNANTITESTSGNTRSEGSGTAHSTNSVSPPPQNDEVPTRYKVIGQNLHNEDDEKKSESDTEETRSKHSCNKDHEARTVAQRLANGGARDPHPYEDVMRKYLEEQMQGKDPRLEKFRQALDSDVCKFTENPLCKALEGIGFDEYQKEQILEASEKCFNRNRGNVIAILQALEKKLLILPEIAGKLVVEENDVVKWDFETVTRAFKIYEDHVQNMDEQGHDHVKMSDNLKKMENGRIFPKPSKEGLICASKFSFKSEYWENLKNDDVKREVYELCRTGIFTSNRQRKGEPTVLAHSNFGAGGDKNLNRARKIAYEKYGAPLALKMALKARSNYRNWWLSDAAAKWRWVTLCWEPSSEGVRCLEYEIIRDADTRHRHGAPLPFEIVHMTRCQKIAVCFQKCWEKFCLEVL